MKIGIDARMLGEKQTGIGLYIENLIKNIAKQDNENTYVLFLRKDAFLKLKLPSENFKKVLADFKWYSLSEQTSFLFKINKENLDLMHFPHFNAPIFYFKKRITTIHDLTPKYFPGNKMNSFFRRVAFWAVFYASIKFSKKIIAVSEYTKKEILKYFKINKSKVEVVYQGVPNLNNEDCILDDKKKKEFLNKFKLDKPYIFYTGVWRNHKNLVGLIKAFHILISKYNMDIYLVLGGREDPFYPEVREAWEKFGLQDRIIRPGFIPKSELGSFLRYADVFVLPSFVEGFGFGPLEAISYHTPPAVSDRGAIREVLGESAVYFNPKDPNDIAKKIHSLFYNEALKYKLLKSGKKRILKYKWADCAKKTIKIYKESQSI